MERQTITISDGMSSARKSRSFSSLLRSEGPTKSCLLGIYVKFPALRMSKLPDPCKLQEPLGYSMPKTLEH